VIIGYERVSTTEQNLGLERKGGIPNSTIVMGKEKGAF
jgi:hypothetical protein